MSKKGGIEFMLDLLLHEELLLQLSVVTVGRLNDQHILNLAIYQKILSMIYSFVTSLDLSSLVWAW